MIYIELTLSGIKSFKRETIFTFPTSPGLYFMFGKNKIEPKLGANATGKSSVWDGLCWVLYGKTLRGLRAGNVKSWSGAKAPYFVKLDFIDDFGKPRTLYRSMAPNKLLLDGTIVTQEELQNTIRIPYIPFLYSVIFGQKNSKFFDLGAGDALKLFTEVLGLDSWLDRSETASISSKKAFEERMDLVERQSELFGELKQIKIALEEYKDAEKTWDKEQLAKKIEVKKQKQETKTKINKQRQVKLKVLEHIDTLGLRLKNLQERRDFQYKLLVGMTNTHDVVIKKIGMSLGRVEVSKENYQGFKNLDEICEVCLQPVSRDHYDSRLLELKKAWKKCTVPMTRLTERRVELEEKIQKTRKERRSIDSDYTALYKEQVGLKSDLKIINEKLVELKRTFKKDHDKKSPKNPFVSVIRRNQSKLKEVSRNASVYKRQMGYLETEIEYAKYWTKGFKEVRLFLVSEFLGHFEVEANNCLSKLGMEDWSLRFEIEAETKSKTIKKGFSVFVESPYNDTPVAWEAWSGGEAQRLILSGSIGLSNMILGQYGASSNIEVWDEPSSWLSEEGIRDLLDTLSLHSKQEKKQIWVVDQRFLEYGDFDGTVTVIKKEKGSYFNWSM